MKKMILLLFSVSLALMLGCGDDDGTIGPEQFPDYRNLAVHLQAMDQHVDQYMEFRIVSNSDMLRAIAVLDPIPLENFDLLMPSAVPSGEHRLDFFADFNTNGSYDPPPDDHAWRIVLPNSYIVETTFVSDTVYTDISDPVTTEPGNLFEIHFTSFHPNVDQLFELRVITVQNGRTVGQYRLGAISQPSFFITIPGIIEDSVDYQIDFYADFNSNGVYDPPPDDHAWRILGPGTANGLITSFAHDTLFTDIGF
jgi:hypothetical protein